MCGIIGSFGTPLEESRFREGLRRLRHRGPDAEGIECHLLPTGELRLGFRRLAIQDLDPRGNQPMADATGRWRIVFNGEIYNVRALRRELEGVGCRFRTTTDTEVLLAGWIAWGIELLPRLVGMFAFCIADLERGDLFLARDHLGIKPLYLSSAGDRFVFASEVKGILPLLDGTPSLDPLEVARYFTFLWTPESRTLFSGIRALPPGGWIRVNAREIKEGRWWDLPLGGGEEPISYREAVDRLEGLLKESVDLQLIGDVPVGAFLSGGVDSSLIVALMRDAGASPLRTHTAVFPETDQRWRIEEDDAPWARRVREWIPGLDAHEHPLTPQVAELLPRMAWHLDDPVADPAALVTYLICEAARPTTTVLLSGMGAEELFGGYPRHRASLLASRYRSIPSFLRKGLVEPIASLLPASRPGPLLGPSRRVRKFVRGAGLPFDEGYLSFSSYYTPEEIHDLLPGTPAAADPWAGHRGILADASGLDPIQRMTYLDLLTFLPSLNLRYTDRASMAASVEVRVPILDHRIVEFVRSLPSRYLLHGGQSKRVLKGVAERHLPRALVHRRKAGFQAPVRGWVQGALRPMIETLLLDGDRLNRRGILDPGEVRRIVTSTWEGREDHALRIWAMLTFEFWAATYLDGDGASPVAL